MIYLSSFASASIPREATHNLTLIRRQRPSSRSAA